jgi:hypothetical protein
VLIGDYNPFEDALTRNQTIGIAVSAVAGLWSLIVYPAFIYMQLQAIAGKEAGIGESYKHGLPRVWAILGMILAITLGLIAVISAFLVPFAVLSRAVNNNGLSALVLLVAIVAFLWLVLLCMRGFYLAAFYIVDKKLGPVQALKQSYRDSRPVTLWIWGVIGVELIFGAGGAILNGLPLVGPILAIVVTYPYIFAGAYRYGEIVHGMKVPTKQ